MAYAIESKGKVYRFETLERAQAVAAQVFDRTGYVVGIAEVTPCYCPDDCGCRRFWTPNYCGCRAHKAEHAS